MQEPQSLHKCLLQRPQSSCLGRVLVRVQTRLHHLDIPVAEFIPQEVIDLLNRDTQFKLVHVLSDFLRQRIDPGQDPAVGACQLRRIDRLRHFTLIEIHQYESCRIPDLICKVSGILHTLEIKAHVISGSIACNQCQTQSVRTVLFNDLQRIDTISERLGHLAALVVTDQSVDQHVLERALPCLLQSGEHHADDPEEDDIVTGHQHICRIEIFQFRRLVRPSQCGERPQCG